MNSTVYELKQYYVAAGGEAETVENITTIPDMIAAITALGAGGGGGGVFNVNCSVEQVTQGVTTYTLNKTWKEIHDAFIAGQYVLITTQQVDDSTTINPVIDVSYHDTEGEDKFYSVGFGIGFSSLTLLALTENDYPAFTQT